MNGVPASEAPPAEFTTAPKATENQLNYLSRLLAERNLLTDEIAAKMEGLTTKKAHAWIERALTIAKPTTAISDSYPAVPEGRYAIWNEEAGCIRFYQVQKPTEGRWNGYTFVKVMASDETWPVKDRAKREAILAEIAKDPKAASLAYGREIGACGVCGRTLTDPDSIDKGIGPVCAGRLGW
jgi:uncharacterized protein DUF6011